MEAGKDETPAQHAGRIRKYEDERRFLQEIPDAFNIKLLGQETWTVARTTSSRLPRKKATFPNPGTPGSFRVSKASCGSIEQDVRWTQAVANVIDTISFGWVLARIEPGAHITMKQVKVDGDHWMPKEIMSMEPPGFCW